MPSMGRGGDWGDLSWLDACEQYYKNAGASFKRQDAGTICRHIAVHEMCLRKECRIDWVASRIHDRFVERGVYETQTDQYVPNLLCYQSIIPWPQGMVLGERGRDALEKSRDAAVQKARDAGPPQAGPAVAGSSRTPANLTTGVKGYPDFLNAYPILQRAIAYYDQHHQSPQFRSQSTHAMCLETATQGLEYDGYPVYSHAVNAVNARYIACRIREAFAEVQVCPDDGDRSEWLPGRSLWLPGTIIDVAIDTYTNTNNPRTWGATDGDVCEALARASGAEENMLVKYVASRIHDAFTDADPQVWRRNYTQESGYDGYIPYAPWFDERGVFVRPRWMPLLHELPDDIKALVEVVGPPVRVLPDCGS